MELEELYGYREFVMLYGLAFIALAAGISKFTHPGLWIGFEPQWLRSLLGFLTNTQSIYLAGGAETVAGALLAYRYRIRLVASLLAVWLLTITVMVASLGLWTIALRDLGLVFLAYAVAADAE